MKGILVYGKRKKMKKPLFLVALHAYKRDQILEQAERILTPDGAHGLILVNNGGHVPSHDAYPNLFSIAVELKEKYPDYKIGTNSLDLKNYDAMTYIPGTLDILWTDVGGMLEGKDGAYLDPNVAHWLPQIRPKYFGGELFKYRKQPEDPEAVAKEAAKHFTLITSGNETGSEPSVEKIREIRKWIGPDADLGIASGISAENIRGFMPYANIFIVATSLNMNNGKGDDFYHYDPDKIKTLRKIIESN